MSCPKCDCESCHAEWCKNNPVKEPRFQIGDTVEWCGVKGTVFKEEYSREHFHVVFDNGSLFAFTEDGRFPLWTDQCPVLKFVSRKKKLTQEDFREGLKKVFQEIDGLTTEELLTRIEQHAETLREAKVQA